MLNKMVGEGEQRLKGSYRVGLMDNRRNRGNKCKASVVKVAGMFKKQRGQ